VEKAAGMATSKMIKSTTRKQMKIKAARKKSGRKRRI
jgi:hypothetical protein